MTPPTVPSGLVGDISELPPPPRFTDRVIPEVFDLRLLARLGVEARGVTREEAVSAHLGRYMYADLPRSAGGRASSMAATRLDVHAVQRLVARYDEVFGTATQDRTGEIAAALTGAVGRYRTLADAGETSLREYLSANAQEREALAFVQRLDALLADMRSIGLPGAELARARERVVGAVLPTQADEAAMLRAALLGLPKGS